ncbi:hypothetical protein ABEX47_21330 [Paenibacillus ehimensis]
MAGITTNPQFILTNTKRRLPDHGSFDLRISSVLLEWHFTRTP